jgi:heptosyltransferase I
MRSNLLFKWLDRNIGIPLVWVLGALAEIFGSEKRAALRPGARLLIIKFSAMGDTLLLLPILKALREAVGTEGSLEMIATPVNQAVVKDCPWLECLHIVKPGRLWQLLGLVFRMRRRHFDAVIDFDQWLRISALLSLASGARLRVGFDTAGQYRGKAYQLRAPNGRGRHEFEQFKDLAVLAGLERSKVEAYAGFLAKMNFMAAGQGSRQGSRAPLVILHPGTGGKRGWQREWPVERYAALGLWLRQEFKARIALSGAGDYEAALCSEIESRMGKADLNCVNQGLRNLVETLREADLLICGNTGVMHLAAGLGTPLLALHGPNPVDKWGPLADAPGFEKQVRVALAKVSCSPCLTLGFEFGCPQRPCMESIEQREIQSTVTEMLRAA